MWKYNLWSPIHRLQSIKPSSPSLCLLQMLYVLYLFLLSCINDQISCFLLLNMTPFLLVHHHGSKMLRSESNSSITQSPIGWQISHFLTLLHEPDSGMCVCTSECVPLGVFYSSCVCVWAASPWTTGSIHNQPSFTSIWFSCMQFECCHFLRGTFWGPEAPN